MSKFTFTLSFYKQRVADYWRVFRNLSNVYDEGSYKKNDSFLQNALSSMFDVVLNIPLDYSSHFAVVLRGILGIVWYMPNWLYYSLQTWSFPLIQKSYMVVQHSSQQKFNKGKRKMNKLYFYTVNVNCKLICIKIKNMIIYCKYTFKFLVFE